MKTIERITCNPAIMGGKPCIRGMRITVATILGLMGSGCSIDEILKLYPYLERGDVLAAAAYGAELASGYEVELQPA